MLPDIWPGYQGMSEPYLTVIPPQSSSGRIRVFPPSRRCCIESRVFCNWPRGEKAQSWLTARRKRQSGCSREDWIWEVHLFFLLPPNETAVVRCGRQQELLQSDENLWIKVETVSRWWPSAYLRSRQCVNCERTPNCLPSQVILYRVLWYLPSK